MKMTKPHKAISNLEQLIREKRELQIFCTYQEKLITYKFAELKKNLPEIVSNEILPFPPEKNTEINSLLDVMNSFLLHFLPARFRSNRLAEIALKLIQVIIIRGFNKKAKKEE